MRVKTVTTEVFQFDELSDEAKDKARSWYGECAAEDSDYWSENVISDATDILKMFGYRDTEIMWSGFCSQSDGACFTGYWSPSVCDPNSVKAEFPTSPELHAIADKFAGILVRCKLIGGALPMVTLTHNRRYTHENSIVFDCSYADDGYDDESAVINCDYNDVIVEASKDLMRWIYSSLESEHDYHNSNEVIDENIRCNEYEFTETGERA